MRLRQKLNTILFGPKKSGSNLLVLGTGHDLLQMEKATQALVRAANIEGLLRNAIRFSVTMEGAHWTLDTIGEQETKKRTWIKFSELGDPNETWACLEAVTSELIQEGVEKEEVPGFLFKEGFQVKTDERRDMSTGVMRHGSWVLGLQPLREVGLRHRLLHSAASDSDS